jgi:2-polyprenyl-6-methoxyphenol hydroxylase-like FAD-dependent oxidoreductase
VPNFFRTPSGPGWVLVGDAGLTMDPITAQGMSDAFRDAELCVSALDGVLRGEASFDAAMAVYQRTRDAQVLPIYEFTTLLATLAPPPVEFQQMLFAFQGNQEAMDGFASVIAGTVSPAEFFSPENVGRLLGAASYA